MTKEEKLRVYSAYLPYDLNIECYSDEEIEVGGNYITTLSGVNQNGITDDLGNDWHFGVRPILYPLEYLTKEIEHEGENIIPMVYFIKKTSLFDLSKCTFEVYEDDGEVYVNAHDGDRVIDSIFYDGNIFWSSKLLDIHEGYRPANPQHIWKEMLLRLHFNIFGLTEDQFINKATLTQK